MEQLKNKWITSLRQKVIGVLFKPYTTHSQVTKTQRRAQRNSPTTSVISTQPITNLLWMPNHSKKSKRLSNTPTTRRQWTELQNQLNSDKKELIMHQELKEQSQLISLKRLICPKDIPWPSSDNSIMVSSMLTLSLRRWKSQTLFNLLSFTQLVQFQRTIQHGTASSHHSNTMLTFNKNEEQVFKNIG